MTDDTDFSEFLQRIRAGDDAAAQELVKRFEPVIRREVRLRLGGRLRRAFDSTDVSQSVLANFFVRAASGEFELDRPDQLAGLLMTMARNRLVSRARNEGRIMRDIRRLVIKPGVLDQVADRQPSPSELASRKELLDLLKTSLSYNELQIFDLRTAGLSWDEIARQLGGSGQARRMQLSRGIERLERHLA